MGYRGLASVVVATVLAAALATTRNGGDSVLGAFVFVAEMAAAFGLGRYASPVPGGVAATLLLVAAVAQGGGNEAPNAFSVLFPLLAGYGLRGRDRLAEELAARGAELDAERDVYAGLSVRYERARIAAELHDIVAHAISVMVVQASAGQRLAAVDPGLTRETFSAIGEAARQAEADMGRLVALLADEEEVADAPDLALVQELVARAVGTGLDVTLRLEGDHAALPASAVRSTFLVVREGLTNALRYASGAPVRVLVAARPDELLVEVVNAAAPGAPDLAGHGSGNGLRGLRERLDSCGGRLDAGPTGDGGWQLRARLPRLAVAVR
ncbi:histidine kinase [Paraconexibacter antarcticus]|uniref:histidine kinase n=1 Tax=Paraconexibacter antarcticus TaxID=2949664 RepID=A0ABY5DN61_9ACTN|nr:histidine kinase [Paraconexibacter antarcticus]UTI63471.1 histidine kinase [Paraconexibacter antarcticus]